MGQEEVAGVGFLPQAVGSAGRHRHRRHASRANKRVHLVFDKEIQQLGKEEAANGAAGKGDDAQGQDGQGLHIKDPFRRQLRANGNHQKDGGNVQDFVGGGVAQAGNYAAFPEQVANHKHRDEGGRFGNKENDNQHCAGGKKEFFGFGDFPGRFHFNLPFALGGQQAHQRGLDKDDAGHIGVGDDGGNAEEVGGQFGGGKDGGGAVGAADNANGAGFLEGKEGRSEKAGEQGQPEGDKDTQLGGRPQEQGFGVGDDGAEVGQRAQAEENQRGQQVPGGEGEVKDDAKDAGTLDAAGGVEVHQSGAGEVAEDDAQADGQQYIGLHTLEDGGEDESAAEEEKEEVSPVQLSETGFKQKVHRAFAVRYFPGETLGFPLARGMALGGDDWGTLRAL